MKLTDNFSMWEFDCHDGTPVPVMYHGNVYRLATALERLRGLRRGRAIAVISGWRTVTHNRAVGGASDSSHLTGEGADIRSGSPAELHAFILEEYKAGTFPELGGVGIYPGWVHFDIRKARDGHLRRWTGKGQGSEPALGG